MGQSLREKEVREQQEALGNGQDGFWGKVSSWFKG
jgi:hypothetical protein